VIGVVAGGVAFVERSDVIAIGPEAFPGVVVRPVAADRHVAAPDELRPARFPARIESREVVVIDLVVHDQERVCVVRADTELALHGEAIVGDRDTGTGREAQAGTVIELEGAAVNKPSGGPVGIHGPDLRRVGEFLNHKVPQLDRRLPTPDQGISRHTGLDRVTGRVIHEVDDVRGVIKEPRSAHHLA